VVTICFNIRNFEVCSQIALSVSYNAYSKQVLFCTATLTGFGETETVFLEIVHILHAHVLFQEKQFLFHQDQSINVAVRNNTCLL